MSKLNLAGVKYDYDNDVEGGTIVRATAQATPSVCPKCGHNKFHSFGLRKIRYIDLPLHGKHTLIDLTRQRYRCLRCGHTFMPELQAFDPQWRLTARAVKWIEEEAIRRPFTHIAAHIGVHEKVVRNVFWRYAQNREKETAPVAGRVIGIDELYLIRQFRCIITNLEKRTVIDLLAERKRPTVERYLRNLDGSDQVETVCIDMWEPYKLAVQSAIPKARIVVDKFHVTKLANECLDRIRKDFQSGLATGQRRDVMRSRFILLRRSQDLKDEHRDKLALWRKSCPELADAYDQKEKFFNIYNEPTAEAAKAAFDSWFNHLPLSIHKAFKPLQTAVKNWEKEIFGYFDSHYTNAFTECLNGIAKMANRQGRGYSFEVIRFKLLFAHKRQEWSQLSMRAKLANTGIPFSTFK